MCDEAVNKCYFAFAYVPYWYKSQEICDSVASEDPFMLVNCPDKYKTQRVCNEVVDDCLAAVKFILDWFGASKIIMQK